MNHNLKKKAVYIAVLLSLGTAVAVADDKPLTDTPKVSRAAAAKLWSWQPVQAQNQPQVKEKKWVRTPIDAFVLAKIEAKGLKPSKDADRATFTASQTSVALAKTCKTCHRSYKKDA